MTVGHWAACDAARASDVFVSLRSSGHDANGCYMAGATVTAATAAAVRWKRRCVCEDALLMAIWAGVRLRARGVGRRRASVLTAPVSEHFHACWTRLENRLCGPTRS